MTTAPAQPLWVFAYGSLIWRPDFHYLESERAALHGFARRFCQASHDHRGTPQASGRVVTLVPHAEVICTGIAYRLPDDARDDILSHLDEREQDGYERVPVTLHLSRGLQVSGVTWIAREGNPSWRAGETLGELARLIAERYGPSGSNREYLYRLQQALQELAIEDPHVDELSRRVRSHCGE